MLFLGCCLVLFFHPRISLVSVVRVLGRACREFFRGICNLVAFQDTAEVTCPPPQLQFHCETLAPPCGRPKDQPKQVVCRAVVAPQLILSRISRSHSHHRRSIPLPLFLENLSTRCLQWRWGDKSSRIREFNQGEKTCHQPPATPSQPI